MQDLGPVGARVKGLGFTLKGFQRIYPTYGKFAGMSAGFGGIKEFASQVPC